jgi:dephospho-CoA kinase
MPFCVGLTGGIGSGKTTVAEMFRRLGADIIDTDAISHGLTRAGAPGHQAILRAFGPEYALGDGSLDRARLRALVFADAAARSKLEAILHPMIRAQAVSALAHAHGPYVLLVVPLLIETGAYRDLIQRILVVDCSEEEQLRRTMARSGLGADEVRAIMAAQSSRAQRLAAADDVLVNSADTADLERQVARLDHQYRQLAQRADPAP